MKGKKGKVQVKTAAEKTTIFSKINKGSKKKRTFPVFFCIQRPANAAVPQAKVAAALSGKKIIVHSSGI